MYDAAPVEPNSNLVSKSSYTLRFISETKGYFLAQLEDIKDTVDECISILEEMSRKYDKTTR